MTSESQLPFDPPLKRGRGRPRGSRNLNPKQQERNTLMVQLYKEGVTLHTIGERFQLTRERVRQILKRQDVTAAEGGQAVAKVRSLEQGMRDKDVRYQKQFGHSWTEHQKLLQIDRKARKVGVPQEQLILYRFRQQRNNMHALGIPWTLTLAEWWQVWEESGKYSQCGRGKGFYAMGRIDRTKGFELGNVSIQEFSQVTGAWSKKRKLQAALREGAKDLEETSMDEIRQAIYEVREQRLHGRETKDI